MNAITSWAVDRPLTSPFALPRGLRGRLAGRFMLLVNKRSSVDVVALLDPRPGSRVLEIGFGPGGLIQELTARGGLMVSGVDPSQDMVAFAGRRGRRAVAAGRVELWVGTAAETGHSDQSVDHVVSVNNVAIWPDLEAGLRELHRVVRPGGTMLLSWHGGTNPSRIGRRLRLPEDKLDRIQRGLAALCTTVTRHELTTQTAFLGTR